MRKAIVAPASIAQIDPSQQNLMRDGEIEATADDLTSPQARIPDTLNARREIVAGSDRLILRGNNGVLAKAAIRAARIHIALRLRQFFTRTFTPIFPFFGRGADLLAKS